MSYSNAGGTQINQLNTTTVNASDLLIAWSSNNSDSRKFTVDALTQYIAAFLAPQGQLAQYASPATGATVSVGNIGQNTRLILSPNATIAALTIALDTAPVDLETLVVSSTQTITALTISGGTVNGAPTTMGASSPFKLQYDGVAKVWHRTI